MPGARIRAVADMLGLSVSRVRQLADLGRLPHHVSEGGHRYFDLAEVAAVLAISDAATQLSEPLGAPVFNREYPREGLAEHLVWQSVATSLAVDVGAESRHILEYSLEEMVNNAVSHSAGSIVRVIAWSTSEWLGFAVSDDGIGALERLRSELGLPDTLSAIQELSKGKRTTMPEEHSGQGIFFTSKALDRFVLVANGWQWTVDTMIGDQTVRQAPHTHGTAVAGLVRRVTTRTMAEVFAEYTRDSQFARTTPRVHLAAYGTTLVSRSEAKLLLEGLDRFSEVDIDFLGVDSVGQGFVDEVFRVWPSRHPAVQVRPINMNEAVRFMVERGLPGAQA